MFAGKSIAIEQAVEKAEVMVLFKNMAFIASIAASFVLAGVLVANFRSQQDTNQSLAAMQRQLDEQKRAQSTGTMPAESAAAPLIMREQGALPTEFARKHAETLQVIDVGWKLINQRSPQAAARAAELFQAAIEKTDDRSPDLYNGLGRALLISGKPGEAIRAWRKGLEIEPRLSEMQSGIGWAYWRLDDPYRAREAWAAALKADPKSADAWSAMVWIELALGNARHSKEGFQVLIARDQNKHEWIMGLSMARAGNTNLAEIRSFFGVPDLERFKTVRAIDPAADVPASSAASATQPAAI